jgi:hypothetical protein
MMISCLSDQNGIALHFVDKAMLVINSPGPVPAQCMTKRLGFSGSFKRSTDNLLDEIIDSLKQFPVCLLPMEIVFPRLA